MIYSVQITHQAECDLRKIFEYIAFDLKSFQSAVGQMNRLEEAIRSLDELPERFPRYQREPWLSRGLRMMAIDKYCVFYFIFHESEAVSIIRCMYCGRNIEVALQAHKGL